MLRCLHVPHPVIRIVRAAAGLVLLTSLIGIALRAQTATAARPLTLKPETIASLQWRNIGPAVTGGRTVDIAVDESNPDVIYAATATGGVWKTTNAAQTWTAVFDRGATASVGDIAVAPSDPRIVWIGTGEAWNARSNSWGDGVYKSADAGRTWKHMGLEKSQHVGRVLVHPTVPDTVYIAAMGALWTSNEERGLYKTTDGGQTWSRVLYVSPYTGVVDVTMHPKDPNVLYAAAFQRERRNWSMLAGGPESALYRSLDAGKTWEKLTNGLPTRQVGRIGLATCPTQPDIVYAALDATETERGVYRSTDRGNTWEKRTGKTFTRSGYGQVRCDPTNADRVYVLDTNSVVSEDGGKTFARMVAGGRVHSDHHALWIDPARPEHLVLGTDGGIYITRDRGQNWNFVDNLVLAQFYTVGVDMQEPFYYVYGGTQDNNSIGGPSGTRHSDGIANADWYVTTPGDGFHVQIDPADPATVYTESQYGRLVRFDTRIGERRLIQPQSLDGQDYRWNWSAPLLISQYDPQTILFAANVVFRSRDRGDSWTVISPDLTRQIHHSKLPLQGKIQPPDALGLHQSTAEYGTIQTLAESPVRAGVVAVGTDDGIIQITDNDGKTWRRIERFPTVPDQTLVSRVSFSHGSESTLYATFDAHQDNDFRPYVLKSTDMGRTWQSITGNLPVGSARVVIEDPRNPNLLFVGTEFGVFASISGGQAWVQINNNLPTVPVYDMLVHPRDHDLVLATHGRGFWILDDITILRELTSDMLARPAHLAAIRPAVQFHRFDRGRRNLGDGHFTAPNPPEGAIITYYVKPASPSGTAAKESATETGRVHVEVLDPAGAIVRQLDPPKQGGAGIRRVIWDLRHSLTASQPASGEESFFSGRRKGAFVLPGQYQIRLTVNGIHEMQQVLVKPDPLIRLTDQDRRTWHDTLLSLDRMHAAATAVISTAMTLRDEAGRIRTLIESASTPRSVIKAQVENLARDVTAILTAMRGEESARRSAEQPGPLPIADQLEQLYLNVEGSTGVPTSDQRRLTRRSYEQLGVEVTKLRQLIDEAVPALGTNLKKAGFTWTPSKPLAMPPQANLPAPPGAS